VVDRGGGRGREARIEKRRGKKRRERGGDGREKEKKGDE
jgi:hypothetical protein